MTQIPTNTVAVNTITPANAQRTDRRKAGIVDRLGFANLPGKILALTTTYCNFWIRIVVVVHFF